MGVTQDVAIYDEDRAAAAVVADGSSLPPAGVSTGLVLVGGSTGSVGKVLAVASDGKPKVLLYDAAGNVALVEKGTAPASNQGVMPAGVFDSTNMQVMAGSTAGHPKVNAHDGSGNALTSAALGSHRAAAAAIYDTAGNILTVVDGAAIGGTQGGVLSMGRDGSGNAQQVAVSTGGHPLSDTHDGSGNAITSKLVGSDRSLAVAAADGSGNLLDSVLNTLRALCVALRDGTGNAITSSAGGASSRLLDVSVRDFLGPVANQASTFGSRTTTATTADQVVVSITVPTGKDFFYCGHSLSKNAATVIDMNPARLRVGSNAWMNRFTTGLNDRFWEPNPPAHPVKIATAGDVVTLTVTPSGGTSTAWRGVIWGFYRDI